MTARATTIGLGLIAILLATALGIAPACGSRSGQAAETRQGAQASHGAEGQAPPPAAAGAQVVPSAPTTAAYATVTEAAGAAREPEPEPELAPEPEPEPEPAVPSVSIGAADDGTLQGGVPLPDEGLGFRFNPRRPQDARYGTRELVDAITTAAAALPPGEPLVVNDLGLPGGGPIAQHGSHQAGRDVDILFFYLDEHGQPHRSIGVPVEPDLTGYDYRELPDPSDDIPLRLDVKRTWQFMAAFVEAAGDHLQRIFIVEHVRDALLAEARRQKANEAIVERFALVTCQPGTPHDDHMHVRFFCTPEDMAEGCLDKPPVYPFRRRVLAELELKPALYRGRPSRAKRKARAERTTTPKQARKRAGRMHRDVIRFLERRKGWLKRSGPPRPYCR